MKQHTLFLIKPGFYDNQKGPYYCPYCAALEGLIKYLPEIEEKLNIRRINFQRPRTEISELIGEENQWCPVLILDSGTEVPPEAKISDITGKAYINDSTKIGMYLGRTFNTLIPH